MSFSQSACPHCQKDTFPLWRLTAVIFIAVLLANITSCYTIEQIEKVRKHRASEARENQFWQDLRDKHGSSEMAPEVRRLPGSPYQ
jgi:hypothetical protein